MRSVPAYRSLARTHPALAAEWHPSLNSDSPRDTTPGSDRKRWWLCPSCQHAWQATVSSRALNGVGCPACAGKVATPTNCLATTHPALASQWHPSRNPDSPSDVTAGSNKRRWWRCGNGHEWQATVVSRAKLGAGCGACLGRVATATRNLAITHPAVAAEWHPTKNADSPRDVTPGAGKRWWKCGTCGFEWRAAVSARTKDATGCPACAGKVVTATNCLARTHARLADEWHPTKNADSPHDVTAGSDRKRWWLCPSCQHGWQATVSSRALNGTGCPACAGQVVTRRTALARTHPALAREWDSERNTDTPYDVVSGSGKRRWWRCGACGHRWATSVVHRTQRGTGCPACANRAVTPGNNLAVTHPALAASWHPALNHDAPADVVAGSHKRRWWHCGVCGHDWQAPVADRALGGRGCPGCAGQVVTDTNNLAVRFPAIAAEWHPTKNADTPRDLVAGSNRRRWWRCAVCGYEWEAALNTRTVNGSGCAACAGQVVTANNCLASTYPLIAAEWHPTRNADTPRDLTPGRSDSRWWLCGSCGYEYRNSPHNRTKLGQGCPACVNRAVTPRNCLAATHPSLAAEWHPTKNVDAPTDFTAGVNDVRWWRCAFCGHEWRASIGNRALRGRGCPHCTLRSTSVTEIRLRAELSALVGAESEPGVFYSHGRRRTFDVAITLGRHRFAIEYDGSYHHRGHVANDRAKSECLADAGYTVVRVRESPLRALAANDIVVPLHADAYYCTVAVLERLARLTGAMPAWLESYKRLGALVASATAEAEIARRKAGQAFRRQLGGRAKARGRSAKPRRRTAREWGDS